MPLLAPNAISATALETTAPRWTPARALLALAVSAAVLMLLVAPLFIDFYAMRVLSMIFLFAVLAQSINLIAGFTGYPAFGNVVFFGLGAYSTATIMVKLQGGFVFGLAVAVLVAATTAVLIGPPLLRLRGHYFAIATVGLNEAVKAVISNLTYVTGGGMGLSLPLPPWHPIAASRVFYYLLFAAMAASILAAAWLKVSRLGHSARAIRDDEVKAEAMGLRTTTIKTAVWAVSAALTGFVGGVYAYWFSYVDPPSVFNMLFAIESFVIFLVGGAATVFGPIVAAFIVEYASTVIWSQLLDYHLGAFGLAIMLIVLFLPDGLMRFMEDRARTLTTLFKGQRRRQSADRIDRSVAEE